MNTETFLLITSIIQTVLVIAFLITALYQKWGGRRRRNKNALFEQLEENELRNLERMDEIRQEIKRFSNQLQAHAKKV